MGWRRLLEERRRALALGGRDCASLAVYAAPDRVGNQEMYSGVSDEHSNFFDLRSPKQGHHGFSKYLWGLGPL
jgi:hypothetical protein